MVKMQWRHCVTAVSHSLVVYSNLDHSVPLACDDDELLCVRGDLAWMTEATIMRGISTAKVTVP